MATEYNMNILHNIWISTLGSPLKQQTNGISAIRETFLGAKESNDPHNVLPTNRTFTQHFSAIRARRHVATFQNNTFDRRIHADLAQIVRW